MSLQQNGDWWRSDVYRLLPMCHVYDEVRRKFSASVRVFLILGFLCGVLTVVSKNCFKSDFQGNLLEQFWYLSDPMA